MAEIELQEVSAFYYPMPVSTSYFCLTATFRWEAGPEYCAPRCRNQLHYYDYKDIVYRAMIGRCWQCGDSHHGAELHTGFRGQLPSARSQGSCGRAVKPRLGGQSGVDTVTCD